MIPLVVKEQELLFLLDTGFNGQLMLPYKVIKKLELQQIGVSDYITASGDFKKARVYLAYLTFLDMKSEAAVLATETNFSLAGMELFHDCRIVIERSKGVVEVNPSIREN